MSKAILSWDLTDPDELMDFNACLKAKDLAMVLWQFMRNSRKEIEWKVENDIRIDRFDAVDMVYDHMSVILDEYSIDLDKLTN